MDPLDKIARSCVKKVMAASLSNIGVSSVSDKLLLSVLLLKKAGIPACAVTRSLGGANDVPHQIQGIRMNRGALLGMKGERNWEEIEASYVAAFSPIFKPTIYSRDEEVLFMEDISDSFFMDAAAAHGNVARFSDWLEKRLALLQAQVLGVVSAPTYSPLRPRGRL